ncbi:MAG: glycosyltransferase family 4 protein [Actinomycetota bacterium]
MTHLLVTNDFPPKVGGIQTYLWELWRRLPQDSFAVMTTAHPGDAAFDARQPFRVERIAQRVLLPSASLAQRIDRLADEVGASLVVLDPVFPLATVGPRLSRPYVMVGHGAEVTVPGRIVGAKQSLSRALRASSGVVAGGRYVAGELRRAAGQELSVCMVPPGVDTDRFHPLASEERGAVRRSFGLPEAGPLVLYMGRLVPRKGADVLIDAAAQLLAGNPDLTLAVGGVGRDRPRLVRRALRRAAPGRFLGRVPDDQLASLYGCADVCAAPNRSRWGGLEQEGFGIVYLEAAACGVPQVAGNNGGVPEAVAHGESGLLVDRPTDAGEVAGAIGRLLNDPALRSRIGEQARLRMVQGFSYTVLAARLGTYLQRVAAEPGNRSA